MSVAGTGELNSATSSAAQAASAAAARAIMANRAGLVFIGGTVTVFLRDFVAVPTLINELRVTVPLIQFQGALAADAAPR